MNSDRTSMIRFSGLVAALALATVVIGALAEGSRPPGVAGGGHAAAATAQGFAAADDVVRLTGNLDRTAVLASGAGEDGVVKLELGIEAVGVGFGLAVPTDFVVILDRSGSMEGEKIARARAAVAEIVGQLTPRDRFALVAYSSGAEVAVPLSAATPQSRAAWQRLAGAIQASGGTNMSGGLDLALEVLTGPTATGRARRLILISDGLANEGDSSFEGLVARAARAARTETVLSTIGVGLDFNESLMGALADRGTGNFYFLREGVELADVFRREFAASRETVVASTEVTLETAAGVRVVDAAGYPLERRGSTTSFRPGGLFAGQQRRIWITLAVPTTPGSHELGAVRLSYQREGRAHTLRATQPLVVQAVLEREEFLDGIDRDRWARSVTEEEYGRLQEKVAALVKEGSKDEAKAEMEAYRGRFESLNRALQAPAVTSNLDELSALERRLDDAFSGENQAAKQQELRKESQAAAWDQRRAGAKKPNPTPR